VAKRQLREFFLGLCRPGRITSDIFWWFLHLRQCNPCFQWRTRVQSRARCSSCRWPLQQVTLSFFPFDSLLKLKVCWCRCSLCASNMIWEKNCRDLLARVNALVFEQCNVEVIGWLCCETKFRQKKIHKSRAHIRPPRRLLEINDCVFFDSALVGWGQL